jgi:hypothetical protein
LPYRRGRRELPAGKLRPLLLRQQCNSLLRRLLLPQAGALRAVSLQLLVPGQLLPQAIALRAVPVQLLVPRRLLPQAAAVRMLPAANGVQVLRAGLRKMITVQ